jgi:hypothetical protein
MSLNLKFKKTANSPVKKPSESRKYSGTSYSLFKPGILPYKFEEGTNLLRLLPQREESPYPNFLEVNVLSFFDEALPIRGTFRVMEEQSWLLSRIFKLLRAHPEYKHLLWSRENEMGLSFSPRPKVVFLGFNINDPEMKVQPIVLPGTLSYPAKDGKARIPQAGTRIAQFVYDTDIHNNLRWGDIFDIEKGRVIRLDVANAGTIRAKYDPAPDADYPLTGKRFENVLHQIKNFDQFIEEPSMGELVKVLKAYLPTEIYEYLDAQIHFNRIAQETGRAADEADYSQEVGTGDEVAPTKSSVPLPNLEEPEVAEEAGMSDEEVDARLNALREEMAKRRNRRA